MRISETEEAGLSKPKGPAFGTAVLAPAITPKGGQPRGRAPGQFTATWQDAQAASRIQIALIVDETVGFQNKKSARVSGLIEAD
jgi:hypothetical protein